jgi:hypothetical protein
VASVDLFERQDLGPFDGDVRRERIEMAHQLRLMTGMPGWEIFEAMVGSELTKWERRILSGELDPDKYRKWSGFVLGLRQALETPAEFQKIVAREESAQAEEE